LELAAGARAGLDVREALAIVGAEDGVVFDGVGEAW
jgi:hypothetical protein